MSEQGAIDADFDDAELSYEQRVANALEDVRTEPVPGSLAIDLVTRQLLFVRSKVADDLEEYYDENGFGLMTYGPHPWLPVSIDDAAYECYYINDLSLDSLDELHKLNDYAFPAGRLAVVGVEQAWSGTEVDGL